MFGLLTSKWRLRAGALSVVLYALCFVAPVAAFAFSDGSMPAHCLSSNHHAIADAYGHDDGMADPASDPGADDHGYPAKCCGLFCVSAIAPAMDFVSSRTTPLVLMASVPAESLSGRGFDRIDRPPRNLSSH
jgi:hypothetical protein